MQVSPNLFLHEKEQALLRLILQLRLGGKLHLQNLPSSIKSFMERVRA
ncbi:MAG: hypothetical protein N3D14_03785 [Aquificaceae bacterium]|nr:hypothetical protein [Aquificaceae bacterium]